MRAFAVVVLGASFVSVAGCASSAHQPSAPPADAAPATGIEVGQLAPDFTLNDSDGRAVRLSDLRGKVVLIEFSAMW